MKIVADLSVTSAPHRARHGWHPGWLFRGGAEGAWFDPADRTTLFQDTGATVPVTSDGHRVALMLDKSGRGKHAAQPVPAARPTWRTDGHLAWLEYDGVDDRLMIDPVPYVSSTFGLCIGLRYQAGGGVWASWRSRDIIQNVAGLSHPTIQGFITDVGGTLRVNALPAPSSRVPLWNSQLTPAVGSATGISAAPFAGRSWQFFSYASTIPPVGQLFGYVECAALTPADVWRVERWMAARTGVTL